MCISSLCQISFQNWSWWHFGSWLRWRPTSRASLAQAEASILSHVWPQLERMFVSIYNGTKQIRTIIMNRDSSGTPLVLVHGMGSGVGLWVMNLESLSQNRPVYALDVLGFGRSSRAKFSRDAAQAEAEFVESIEEWRKQVKLEEFILLGHSLGGFLATSYAIRYPDHIRHLILVDPWGFAVRPAELVRTNPMPFWLKAIGVFLKLFNPFSGLRAAGPWGPWIVERTRPDLTRKFHSLFEDNTVAQYLYHCNAQDPSGEIGFTNMSVPVAWAKQPMIHRVQELPKFIPITMLYGSWSPFDSSTGFEVKYIRSNAYVDVQVVKGAGHHVYADRVEEFNRRVNLVCLRVDDSQQQDHRLGSDDFEETTKNLQCDNESSINNTGQSCST